MSSQKKYQLQCLYCLRLKTVFANPIVMSFTMLFCEGRIESLFQKQNDVMNEILLDLSLSFFITNVKIVNDILLVS